MTAQKPAAEAAIDDAAALLKKRLSTDNQTARSLAQAYVLGTLDNAAALIESRSVAPTAMAAHRVQLVENIAFRLGRLPTARELTAMLRFPEATSKSVLRNVLAMSDRVKAVALKSAFSVAQREKDKLGGKGAVPGGAVWKFKSNDDLELARTQLEEHGIDHATLAEADGKYRLAVDASFDPNAL